MTESERMSISGLLDVLNTGISLSTCHIEYVIQSNVLEDLIRCLEELEQYRAIGTIEEFKELKDYKELYDVYRNIGSINEFRNLKNKKNVLPIANITIDEEDIQKIVDEKIKEIELDIQEIRAKAIDEFTSTLIPRLTDAIYQEDVESMTNLINDVARELKAGGENE